MRSVARSEPHTAVVTVRVTATEYAQLVEAAQKRGDASMGSMVRIAIRQFLAQEKSESGTAVSQDARTAF